MKKVKIIFFACILLSAMHIPSYAAIEECYTVRFCDNAAGDRQYGLVCGTEETIADASTEMSEVLGCE